jgi:hypothetical protein
LFSPEIEVDDREGGKNRYDNLSQTDPGDDAVDEAAPITGSDLT